MTTLKAWRNARSVTQSDFAERIRATAASVSRIEAGDQWPSGDIIGAIERETDGEVTAADILSTYQEAQSSRQPAE